MDNRQKLAEAFCSALNIPEDEIVDGLSYESIPQWDSVAHMALIAALEQTFDLMLDTDEILAMSSVAAARGILSKHDVKF